MTFGTALSELVNCIVYLVRISTVNLANVSLCTQFQISNLLVCNELCVFLATQHPFGE